MIHRFEQLHGQAMDIDIFIHLSVSSVQNKQRREMYRLVSHATLKECTLSVSCKQVRLDSRTSYFAPFWPNGVVYLKVLFSLRCYLLQC